MSETIQLTAEPRERTGKEGARALRKTGMVPAIVYGGKEPPQKVALVDREIRRQLELNPRFFSSVVELKLGKKVIQVIPREAQLHPVKDHPLHVDFLRAAKGSTVTVEVPVHFLNEERCPGLRRGGVLNIVRREIELVCPVEAIPERIDVDLAAVEIGDSVHISAVTLPANVTPTITDRDFTICAVVGRGPTADEDEEGEGEGAEAGGEADD
ncbi:MAG: 50S ribosomal protein L25/general stress protein Ctc [Geminicoccaceae bacterium]|jgi:large subunit ribosomal protein L25|nr:50S ribosomal protein L25/general stress protein Ctc [Geminicoccaceae bacterium]MCB9966364.1 50S ribosomal protein L25/general stress protein Ctc [Geminicoccaceae bacterium]HRY23322.1 50S ribosomal protein L25/general stress protein Ctc [Geminicoccaceae bacterium]